MPAQPPSTAVITGMQRRASTVFTNISATAWRTSGPSFTLTPEESHRQTTGMPRLCA
ncbi:MAG: hypothetical protein QXI02_07615 [Candidatus Caldarchaeum sp.]